MYFSARPILLGSALLLAALPAAASDEAVGPAAAPAPRATMNCPGISSAPMTADVAQAVPLHLLRSLSCGESVVILSESEGYTVHVLVADGTAGYVARMYLNMGAAPSVPDHQTLSATAVNNVVRWQAGAPDCDQFFSKGHTVESATANGVTVQVSLEDSGWKLRATVAVSNKAAEVVELFPALITLDELQPNLKSLLARDPAKLLHVVNHQVLLTQANAQSSPSAVAYHRNNPPAPSTAMYHLATPDCFSEDTALTSDSNHAAIVPSASQLRALALKHTKLTSGQKTTGLIWFERDANARELSLRIPVGDLVFDFPLSFEQKHLVIPRLLLLGMRHAPSPPSRFFALSSKKSGAGVNSAPIRNPQPKHSI
jgi:hypothetical protein